MSRILICIDHKWRDLPGHVYAGILLEKMGHDVYYVRHGLEKYYISAIKPELVLLIHILDKEKQTLVRYWSKQGIKIALLPTEGIPTLKKYRAFSAGADIDLSHVDIQFVWNQPIKNILKNNPTISQSRIHVIGVPRFDFYKHPLSKILMSKEEFCKKYRLNPNWPIITLATNFTQSQFYEKNQYFFWDDANRMGYKKVLDDMFGNVSEVPKRDFESREIIIDAFLRLIRDYPRINFIIKPHPSEDHEFYRKLIQNKLSQFKYRAVFITQEYIWDILNVTDIELKRSCTTGAEMWILGKPTIEMKLNPQEWYFSEDHASGSDMATNYEDLKQLIKGYLNGNKINKKLISARQAFLDKWCYQLDGKATERMVQVIDNALRSEKTNLKIQLNFKNILIYFLLVLSRLELHNIKVYRWLYFIKDKKVDRLGRYGKYFAMGDLKIWKKRIAKLLS